MKIIYIKQVAILLTNYLIDNNLGNLVIENNPSGKQGFNIGSSNNQNFVQIPFSNLIQKLLYKAREGRNIQR